MRRTRTRGLIVALVITVAALAGTLHASAAAARTWLGVVTQEIDSDLRAGLDLHGDGVLVNQVMDDSPAQHAGLRKGDVIVRFNSRAVTSPADLSQLVGDSRDGQAIALSIVRDGSARTLSVTLGTRPGGLDMSAPAPEAPETPEAPEAPSAPEPGHGRHQVRIQVEKPDGDGHSDNASPHTRVRIVGPNGQAREFDGDLDHLPNDMRGMMHGLDLGNLGGLAGMAHGGVRLGVRVEPLNEDLGAALGVQGHDGVLVLEVMKDTPAEHAGLRSGDVILSVNDQGVANASDLVAELAKVEGTARVGISRRGERRTVEAELGSASSQQGEDGDQGQGRRGDNVREYRFRARDGADNGNLQQQLDDLRQQLRELRRQLEERDHR